MSKSYSFVEVREHLADVIARAEAGEHSTVTRYGKPVAAIGPLPPAPGETRTVRLSDGGTVTLNLNCRPLMLSPEDREFVFGVIEAFKKLEARLDNRDTETTGEQQ